MTPFVKEMLKIASDVYPECVRIVGTGSYTYLDIRWDDIVIQNRNNASHRIIGMHVSLPFSSGQKKFQGRIHGWRDTLSYAEHRSGYAHSHLPGTSFTSFCTGMDGINNVWGMVQTESGDYRTINYKDTFRGFLYLLDAFIKYESLEGVPHRRISRIGLGNNSGMPHHRAATEAKKIMGNIDSKLITLSIDFNTGIADLVETDQLHEAMVEHTRSYAHRLPNGTYQSFDQLQLSEEQVMRSTNMAPLDPETMTQFPVTILAHLTKVTITDARKFIHPDILDLIKLNIKQHAEEQIIQRTIREFTEEGFEHKTLNQDKKEGEITTNRKFSGSAFAVSYTKTKSGMVWESPLEVPEENGFNQTSDSSTDSHIYEVAESG